jgi:hypothetical protein
MSCRRKKSRKQRTNNGRTTNYRTVSVMDVKVSFCCTRHIEILFAYTYLSMKHNDNTKASVLRHNTKHSDL